MVNHRYMHSDVFAPLQKENILIYDLFQKDIQATLGRTLNAYGNRFMKKTVSDFQS